MRAIYTSLLLLTIPFSSFLAAGCGGGVSTDSDHMHGIVTAKVAPQGTADCTSSFPAECDTGITWKVVIEPLPGGKDTGGGWYEPYSVICVPPTAFRRIHIGDVWNGQYHGDLHCDG